VYLAQDTLPDDTPTKLGMGWAVDAAKPWFVGKLALERMAARPVTRRLAGFVFDGAPADASALRGQPLLVGDTVTGRITSAAQSDAVGRAIGLGWIRAVDGAFPAELRAGETVARVVRPSFYDPEGTRVRG
jgi:glycine cleavage system aminomethyltransferase T